MEQAYGPSEGLFLELFGARLHEDVRRIVPGLNDRVMRMIEDLAVDERLTLAHGDYRLDNVFFGGKGATYPIAVIDWQSPNRGWGAYDVAYFISGSFPVEQRRNYEQRLIRAYYETYGAQVKLGGYTLDQFFDDYRRSLLVYLAIFVINGATLELTNQRAVDLFNVIFDRLNAALVDLNVVSLLPA
jgi:Ser/Thr protein kinase RdoA (MazF antagonist)